MNPEPNHPPSESQEAFFDRKLKEAGTADRQIASARRYHADCVGRHAYSRVLVDLGLAADEDAARWIAEYRGWEYLPPEGLRSSRDAQRVIPEPVARNRNALAVGIREGRLRVAVADPLTPQFSQVVHAVEGRAVEWVIAPGADIAAAVADTYAARVDVSDNELERFVETMFREAALTRGLSDIHLVPGDRSCEIRWRVDGDLIPWRVVPGSMRESLAAQIKLASTRGPDGRTRGAVVSGGLDVSNRLEAQDASAVREYGSKRISLRFSAIPAINGESIVIRILDQGAQAGSLEGLGMLADTVVRLRGELTRPNGIVLIVGPTGHGKSTTLAACVPWLDVRARRVLSVEDPVEYRLRGVTQVPVTPRLSFAAALRAFLRHNPDVIFVGEIRDAETAALGIRLALTGHLILTTVHANSAIQALNRLLDLGSEASMLAATVRLMLGQRLVKRLCPGCRRPHRGSDRLIERYGAMLGRARTSGVAALGGAHFSEAGGGCAECKGTGFVGRLGLFECRDVRPALARRLGTEGARFDPHAAESIFSEACASGEIGARTLCEDGLLKAADGTTTPEEVFAATLGEAGASPSSEAFP